MIQVIRWLRLRGVLGQSLPRVLLVVILMNLVFGALFYVTEREAQPGLTLVDGLWWAMVTMTTVGYGDYYAHTTAGRLLASFPAMIAGIGLVGYLAGTVAETVSHRLSTHRKGLLAVDMQDHFVIW